MHGMGTGWALGQWKRVQVYLVCFWTCRTALEAAQHWLCNSPQAIRRRHPLQVGRSRKLKIYLPYPLSMVRKQGDSRHYVDPQHNLSADFFYSESITHRLAGHVSLPIALRSRCYCRFARVGNRSNSRAVDQRTSTRKVQSCRLYFTAT